MDISSFESEVMQFAIGVADEFTDFKSEVEGDGAKQVRWDFVSRHLFHLILLGEEVIELHKAGFSRTACLGARSMLESFFQIAATKAKPDFALEKTLYDVTEYLKKFRNQGLDQETISFLEKQIEVWKITFNVTPPKRLRVVDICELGEVGHLYRGEYALLSGRVHVTTEGLLSHLDCSGNGLTLQSALGALITGTGFAILSIPTRTPQMHVDRGTQLLNTLIEFIERGAFKDPEPSGNSEDFLLP